LGAKLISHKNWISEPLTNAPDHFTWAKVKPDTIYYWLGEGNNVLVNRLITWFWFNVDDNPNHLVNASCASVPPLTMAVDDTSRAISVVVYDDLNPKLQALLAANLMR
jgi:hypothetical protein